MASPPNKVGRNGPVNLSWHLSVGVGPRNAPRNLPSSLTDQVNTKITRHDATTQASWRGPEHVYRMDGVDLELGVKSRRTVAGRDPDAIGTMRISGVGGTDGDLAGSGAPATPEILMLPAVSVEARIIAFLSRRRGQLFCDDCLRRELQLTQHAAVEGATESVGAAVGFRRATETGAGCGGSRLGPNPADPHRNDRPTGNAGPALLSRKRPDCGDTLTFHTARYPVRADLAGRPPLVPFLRAAAALAGDVA